MAVDDKVLQSFRDQSRWCQELGSPFTASLLTQAVSDLEQGGPLVALLGHWDGNPTADALPLRFAGALHALVLAGIDADLAACYPPQGAAVAMQRVWPAVLRAIDRHRAVIDAYLAAPPQTNEIRRSAVLLGGFLTVQQTTGLPLVLLEIGASAGLNSIWDRYRYRLGETDWGDPESPVVIETAWSGGLPPLSQPEIRERAACDRSPVDLSAAAQRLRLRAYVWADQRDRLARLDGAIALALKTGCRVEQADAADWLEGQLGKARPGAATVVYHSIMWQYMPAATRRRIEGLLQQASTRSDRQAPLAWLRFEPGPEKAFELRLTLWPDGADYLLATAHPHGAEVQWLGAAVRPLV